MTEDLHISYEPSAEQLKKFPGLIALQVIYENYTRDCAKCDLHKTRTNVVFGTGNSETPDIAFLGEAPGAEEDESGFPFVGKSGKLVTKIIEAMGYERNEVYILNTVCCRPPENRNPDQDEIEACRPNMRSQLRAVRPKVIVCLGKVPAHALLGIRDSVGDMRRHWYEYEGIPVRVTYHPAFLLRDPSAKSRTWTDMQEVLKKLGKEPPK